MEERKEKEMIQQYLAARTRGDSGWRSRENRHDHLEDWRSSTVDRDRKEEKFDQTKVAGILSKRKEKESLVVRWCLCTHKIYVVHVAMSFMSLQSDGPSACIRPGGWGSKKGSGSSATNSRKSLRLIIMMNL